MREHDSTSQQNGSQHLYPMPSFSLIFPAEGLKSCTAGVKQSQKNINRVQEISKSPHKLFTKYYILVELMLSEIQIAHKHKKLFLFL